MPKINNTSPIAVINHFSSEGRRHDSGMLLDSGLLQVLEQNAFSTTNEPMCLYGDPAYPLRVHLQAPFREAILTDQMKLFNASMSATRISVEWLFGDIINYFKFLDFKKNLIIWMSSIGKMYVVSAILRNALTCLYGNQTSDYFNLEPPTLEEFLFKSDNINTNLNSHVQQLYKTTAN